MPKAKKEMIHQKVVRASKERASERYEKHYHPSNPHHKKHIIADSILGALVVVLGLFSLWLVVFYSSAVAHEQIDLIVSPAVTTVRSGDSISYTITVQNNSGSRLDNASLTIPQNTGFLFSQSFPEAENGNIISLGTLDNGERMEISVAGTTMVSVTDHLRLSTVLHYNTTFSGVKQKLASEAVTVNGSTLSLEYDLPETIIANQSFPFKITYKNSSNSTTFDEVVIIPNFPPALALEEVTREYDEELGGWNIGTVGALGVGVIEGRASINTAELDIALLDARIFSAPFGKPLLQELVSKEIPVKLPNVEADLTSNLQTVTPGDGFTTELTIENKEEFAISNVQVRYKLNPALFATKILPEPLDAEGYFTQTVVDSLPSDASIATSTELRIRENIIPELAFGTTTPRVLVDAEIIYTDNNQQPVVIPVRALNLALNTDLSINAFARYYSVEGDQIGRGPLPPVVGETTKYWVFLELSNSIHEVEALTVRASLPQGLSFTGKSSVTAGSAIEYNQGNNTIEWKLDEMPDYKTNFSEERFGAAFEVAFTPTASQVGKSVVLLREIEVQGKDKVTGKVITDLAPLVTNTLINDSFATDTGEVEL